LKIANNRERIVNIIKGIAENNIKPSVKEQAAKCYEKIASMGIASGAMKTLRIEEEKKMMEHEKDIWDRDKLEFYKEKKLLHNGIKGYESKSSFPKSSSQVKIKKTVKKKKVVKKKKAVKS